MIEAIEALLFSVHTYFYLYIFLSFQIKIEQKSDAGRDVDTSTADYNYFNKNDTANFCPNVSDCALKFKHLN